MLNFFREKTNVVVHTLGRIVLNHIWTPWSRFYSYITNYAATRESLRGQKKTSKVNKPPRRFDMYHIRETIQTNVGAMNKLK